jgi:hypothetical protein
LGWWGDIDGGAVRGRVRSIELLAAAPVETLQQQVQMMLQTFQVVFAQDLVDAVEHGRALLRQPRPKGGQLPIVGLLGRRRLDAPQPVRMLPFQKLLPMDPQPVAQVAGVAAVGLLFRALGGLDDDDFPAAVLLEHCQQPGVHAADFEDRQKSAFRLGLLGKIGKEGTNLLPLGAHLPLADHRSAFVAQVHRQLTPVLVDTKV